jgi:hypothetical protein
MCKLENVFIIGFVATRRLLVCVDDAKLQWQQAEVL